jgi:ferritin-like metal-binding protein YciE
MSTENLRALAIAEIQRLCGSEPKLARAFGRLKQRATERKLKRFCAEGVTYTNRRVRRLNAALRALKAPVRSKTSLALPGLIADALKASALRREDLRDAAILAAIEPISHYGLALYASINRFLLGSGERKAREILQPSLKEKLDAIAEMGSMAAAQVAAIKKTRRGAVRTKRRTQ